MQSEIIMDRKIRDAVRALFILFYDCESDPQTAGAKMAVAVREASKCLYPSNGDRNWNERVDYIRRQWIKQMIDSYIIESTICN